MYVIYADQLGWLTGGQWGGIYGSPMECLGSMSSLPAFGAPQVLCPLSGVAPLGRSRRHRSWRRRTWAEPTSLEATDQRLGSCERS